MNLGSISFRQCLRLGAVEGAAAWTAYAVLECVFAAILAWIVPIVHDAGPTNRAFTLFMFAVYAVGGAITGAIGGFLLKAASLRSLSLSRKNAAHALRGFAALTIILAVAANDAVFIGEARTEILAAILAVLAIVSMSRVGWSHKVWFAVNPWTVSLLLLGALWIDWAYWDSWSYPLRTMVVIAYAAVVVWVSKALERRHFQHRLPIIAGAVALSVVFIFTVGQKVQKTAQPAVAAAPGAPNIILISLDTVRADHLSIYGYARDTSPNLTDFARGATLFTRAISAGNMTLSSHASMFTGTYPTINGAHPSVRAGLGEPLDSRFPTLAAILARNGYDTVGVIANFGYLGAAYGLSRGFAYYDARSGDPFLGAWHDFYLRERVRNLLTRFGKACSFDRLTRTAGEVNAEAISLLRARSNAGRPFFLFLNYMDAHWPYVPPQPYDSLFPGKLKRRFTSTQYHELEVGVLSGSRHVSDEERRHLISQYDGGIAYMDAQFGRFVESLKGLGIFDNALIIVTADHGESFGAHDIIEHGTSVYEEQVHVPLLVKLPLGCKPLPRVVDGLASGVDVLPTILEAAHIPIPKYVQGQSLLEPGALGSRTVLAESYPNFYTQSLNSRFKALERAVFRGSLKLITAADSERQLFDLRADPQETNNLYAGRVEVARNLELAMTGFLVPRSVSTDEPSALSANPQAPAAAIEKLKSLGYLQ